MVDTGYSSKDLKDEMVDIRREETLNAYEAVGYSSSNVIRLIYKDFSLIHNLGLSL